MRVKVTLRCSECKQRNYNTMKNKKNFEKRVANFVGANFKVKYSYPWNRLFEIEVGIE